MDNELNTNELFLAILAMLGGLQQDEATKRVRQLVAKKNDLADIDHTKKIDELSSDEISTLKQIGTEFSDGMDTISSHNMAEMGLRCLKAIRMTPNEAVNVTTKIMTKIFK